MEALVDQAVWEVQARALLALASARALALALVPARASVLALLARAVDAKCCPVRAETPWKSVPGRGGSWLLGSQIRVMRFHQRSSEQVSCSAVVENIHGCSEFRDIFCDTNWQPCRA